MYFKNYHRGQTNRIFARVSFLFYFRRYVKMKIGGKIHIRVSTLYVSSLCM